ncbi:MAG: hypothetical protein CVU39_23405 [Chloroflexi bacterium HGW-Chloroflexi-10]|nr:MAG: hypothetical protein CVU39_23405 [Chloroflexi bacterium HGW-Chloroflexi-10]
MITKFWDKFAENLAVEWQTRLFTLPLTFWSGGLLMFCLWNGWAPLIDLLSTWNSAQSIAALAGGIILIAISSALMDQFTMPLLRFLEGYWRGPLASIAQNRIRTKNQRIGLKEERWSWLAKQKANHEITAAQLAEYARLDAELANYPVNESWRMPTRLGNLLRAAEEYSGSHYGLEINITWPRLWLLLPESAQKEIARARQSLDKAVQTLGWALLFVFWSFWNPWSALLSIGLVVIFYQAILQSAGAYGELLRAAYDLYRFELYDAMHWPKPDSPASEAQNGTALTNYLHRAEAGKKIRFEFPGHTQTPSPTEKTKPG